MRARARRLAVAAALVSLGASALASVPARGATTPVACRSARAFVGASPTMQAARLVLAARCDAAAGRPLAATPDVRRSPVVGDFNGDGRSDVFVYAAGTRADRLWYGTGTSFRTGAAVNVNGFYFPFVGDFNGDGHDDILWFPLLAKGETSVWYGAGGSTPFRHGPLLHAPTIAAQSPGDTYIPGIGDFDADGKADIGWLDFPVDAPGTSAKDASIIWYGRAPGFHVGSNTVATPPCGTSGVCTDGVADYNGDGRADILFYRSGRAADAIVYSTGTGFGAGPKMSVSGIYAPFSNDFNGDGKSDVFWYAPGPDHDYLWYGKASGFTRALNLAVRGRYTPIPGDFNGNAKTDIVWYAPGGGKDFLWYGQGYGFRNGPRVAVNGFYVPATGDFNADGKTDIVWLSTSSSKSHVWYGAAPGFRLGNPIAL